MAFSWIESTRVERAQVNDQLLWVKNQIKSELNKLQQGIDDQQKITSFYEKNEKGGYDFNVDMVQKYLQSIQNKSLAELMKRNSAAWAMAVQIALKIHGYDPGKIDGIFANKAKNSALQRAELQKSKTLAAVRAFQEANGIVGERGWPGSQTIKKLIEGLHLEKVKEVVVKSATLTAVQYNLQDNLSAIVIPSVTTENSTSTTSLGGEQTSALEQTGNDGVTGTPDQQQEEVTDTSGYAVRKKKLEQQRKQAEEKWQEYQQQQGQETEGEKKNNSEEKADMPQEQANDKQAKAKVWSETETEEKAKLESGKIQPKTFDTLLTVKGTKDEDIVFNEGVLDTNGVLSFEGKQYLRYDPEHPEATQGKLSYKVGYVTVASYWVVPVIELGFINQGGYLEGQGVRLIHTHARSIRQEGTFDEYGDLLNE